MSIGGSKLLHAGPLFWLKVKPKRKTKNLQNPHPPIPNPILQQLVMEIKV